MKHPQRSRKARAAVTRRSFAGLMQPGRGGQVEGGFVCPVCENSRTGVGGAFVAQPFPPVAVCLPCFARIGVDAAFKQRAEARIREFAPAEFARHLADDLRRPVEALKRVFSASESPADWDTALGLPAGSSAAAVAQISAMGAVSAHPVPQSVRDAVQDAARTVGPELGISPGRLADEMLSHPDFDQLMAEALALHQRDTRTARRH